MKIGENGNIYYTCPMCVNHQVVDPTGLLICTNRTCRYSIPIKNVRAFVDTYNVTLKALIDIPRAMQHACYEFIGRPMNAMTSTMFRDRIRSNMSGLVRDGIINNYELNFRQDGSVECDFVMPAILNTMKIEFGID